MCEETPERIGIVPAAGVSLCRAYTPQSVGGKRVVLIERHSQSSAPMSIGMVRVGSMRNKHWNHIESAKERGKR